MLRWFLLTVVVGLIPFSIRASLTFVINNNSLSEYITVSDIVAFGLVLTTTNLNAIVTELNVSQNIMMINTALSVVFLAIFSVLYSLSLLVESQPEIISLARLKFLCLASSAVYLVFSAAVWHLHKSSERTAANA